MIFCGETGFKDKYKKWYEASAKRFSTRMYFDKAVEEKDKNKIIKLCNDINALGEGIRLVPVFSSEKDMFTSFGFTQLKNVPAFVAIFTDGKKGAFEKAGFYGEALCLEITAMNIKSCWVSGSIKKKNLGDYIEPVKGEKFLTSIALGYGLDLNEAQVNDRRKRKPFEKIFEAENADNKVVKVVECAWNAPSAINRQPWKYEYKEDTLYVKNPIIKGGPYPAELDIGISMLHVSAAAKALGYDGEWERSKGNFGAFRLI